MSDETVFVVGAGFTRAFVPQAPLLVDDYKILCLRKNFKSFPHAVSVLDQALSEYNDGSVDLEKLMTRVSGMPYDAVDARHELALLETALRRNLVKRITDAKAQVDWAGLQKVARLGFERRASFVTFNYDDILEAALWEVAQNWAQSPDWDPYGRPAWHPDGGYGFYCRPSIVCVSDVLSLMDQTRILVLKLHGSINWRTRLGEGATSGPAAILHHEDWYSPRTGPRVPLISTDIIEQHLESAPFIIPPVLVKAELAVHPVLSVVWKLAYEQLKAAKTVTFIGYSLPVTDLASRTLFSETLKDKAAQVQIVNLGRTNEDENRIKSAYQSLLPNLPHANFSFSGASAWIESQS